MAHASRHAWMTFGLRESSPSRGTHAASSHQSSNITTPPSPIPSKLLRSNSVDDAQLDYFSNVSAYSSSKHRSTSVRNSPSRHPAEGLAKALDNFDAGPITRIVSGSVRKHIEIPTALLISKSEFFAEMAPEANSMELLVSSRKILPMTASALAGPFYFPDLDEFAMDLFHSWVLGAPLISPHDFHSLNHWLGLYVIGHRFGCEGLRNTVMDTVRAYYRHENMTAPAFRVDYVYGATSGACPMREFLITTAAYRALSDGEHGGISASVKGVLRGGGDIAIDFAEKLVELEKNEHVDVRKGDDCRWHDHEVTERCAEWTGFQPYESP